MNWIFGPRRAYHRWRAWVWQWRYLEARGRLGMMDRAGSWDQFDRQIIEARKMFAEGLCCYHRLMGGEPL